MRRAKLDAVLREAVRQRDTDMSALLDRCLKTDDGRFALEYWAAKNCIELERAWGDEIVSVSLTDDGLTYFPDRSDARRRAWADRLFNFVVGFLSGLFASVATALILSISLQ